MLRHTTRSQPEGGYALPIFALVLVLLLVMVAFAVDLGATAEVRRDSQNSADAAALAAAQELGSSSAKFSTGAARTAALAAATTSAMRYIEDNIGIPATSPSWGTCTDANALAVASASTPCISFSSDATQVRVRVPDTEVEYRFAKVAGFEGTTVRSSAIAEVTTILNSSTRPILLRAARYGLNCVEGGGNRTCPSNPPPLGPGDFGSMDSPRYRYIAGGGDPTNFALGLDHSLQLTATNGRNYCDSDNNGDANKCSSQANGLLNNTSGTYDFANYVVTGQGGQLSDVTLGLVGERASQAPTGCPAGRGCFSDGSPAQTVTALLYRPDGAQSEELVPSAGPATPTIDGFGRTGFNGVHISRYLTPTASTAAGCGSAPSYVTTSVEDQAFDDCNQSLSAYILNNVAAPPTVFDADIINSPRFGVAPVTATDLSGASTVAQVIDFYGIYIDRMYGNNNQVKGFRAFVFPLSMIEPIPGGTGPGMPYVGGPFGVRLIR